MSAPEPRTKLQSGGFWLGLGLGALIIVLAGLIPRPDGLSVEALRLAGVTVIVGVWWVTEALPLGATALLPAALFPLLSIAPAKVVSPAYMSPFILLLLGGFLLGLPVEESGVHRRIALWVLLVVGTSPRRLVLGFAIAAAGLSMWISNTATTLIMMPIALAVADRARDDSGKLNKQFAIAILLATGYGASIGGMGTPVGTPPNLIALGAMAEVFKDAPPLTFVDWALRAAIPVAVILPLMWLLLTRFFPRVPKDLTLGAADLIKSELKALGAWRPSERRALIVFGIAAVLWVSRPDLKLGDDYVIAGWASRLGIKGVHDGTIAIFAACIAFALPNGDDKSGSRLLPWATALRVPWGLVLLFGGGVALSRGFVETGLSTFLGERLGVLASGSPTLLLAVTTLTATFGTEIISNTALANITMPILASTALASGQDPAALMVPVALACSCAFMMPAATGPNAIVFGTGRIRIGEMVKAGFMVNWAAWSVIFIYAMVFMR